MIDKMLPFASRVMCVCVCVYVYMSEGLNFDRPHRDTMWSLKCEFSNLYTFTPFDLVTYLFAVVFAIRMTYVRNHPPAWLLLEVKGFVHKH